MADKTLDDCFHGDFFTNEKEEFILKIYSFLNINIKNFENNDIIIKGIQAIIDNLNQNFLYNSKTF